MSQDDLNNVGGDVGARGEAAAALPDDGMIHEWLDGELDAVASARFDALVQLSPVFAARVAEARGLVAASSRILMSLDGVPGGVLPASESRSPVLHSDVTNKLHAAFGSSARTDHNVTRGRRWARWGSIAAVFMVGVTSVLVARREPVSVGEIATMAVESVALTVPAAPMAAAPATPETRESASQSASLASASAAATAPPAPVVPSPELLTSPVSRTAERVAADPALRPGLRAVVVDSAHAAKRQSVADVPPSVSRSAALNFSATDAAPDITASEFVPIQSDIAREDLALAVQRVVCRPNCEQTRLEFATDGRVRRWAQTVGGGAPADTGRVTASELRSLRALIDSLELASLPAMARLDGRRCTTVGSLRESMRVEFRHEDTVRSVLGLPWCSDGTHPLDRVSNAAHALATQQLGPASRR